jgi:hypothetical protein
MSSTSRSSKTLGAYGAAIDAKKVIIGGGYGMSPAGIPSYQSFLTPIPGGFNPVLSGTCKFSALFSYLQVLHGLLDSHTHTTNIPALTVVESTTVPNTTISSPTPTFTAPLTPLAVAIESSTAWILEA